MFLKKKSARGGIALAVAVLLSNVFAPLASAATNTANPVFNFTVSPPSVAVETLPGKPITVDVRIQNQGLVSENVKVRLMKFTAEGETGLPNLKKFEPTDDFGKWAQVSPTTLVAEPNTWKTVKLDIAPPKDAAFGYYYALVFSRDGADKQTVKNKSNLLGEFASLVLLDVKAPGAVRKVNVAEFSTKAHVTEFLPENFNVRLRNVGNTHVGVSGSISISKHGKLVDEIDVNSSKGYIIPTSYRNFTTSWKDGTPVYKVLKDNSGKIISDKQGEPVQSLSWDNLKPSKFRIGKYDARLVMIYDDGHGNVSTTARLSFWVIPWRVIAAFMVVGLLILAGLWVTVFKPLVKRLKHKRGYATRR